MAAQLALLALLISSVVCTDHVVKKPKEKVKVCYYNTKALERSKPGLLKPEDIDVALCTHIVIGFAKIEKSGTIKLPEEKLDITEIAMILKRKAPKVKVLLGIKTTKNRLVPVLEPELVTQVIENLKKLNLTKKSIDGIDLFLHSFEEREEEVPLHKNLPKVVKLIQKVKTALKELIVTATCQPLKLKSPMSKEVKKAIPELIKHVDVLNLATFHSRAKEIVVKLKQVINEETNKDASLEKVTLGLATFGRTFKPDGKGKISIKSKTPGPAGEITKEEGILATYEICPKIKSLNISREDPETPYAYNKDIWIRFNDEESMMKKLAVVQAHNLLGVAVYSIDLDDFKGACESPANSTSVVNFMTIKKISAILSKRIATIGGFIATEPEVIPQTETTLPPVVACYYNSKAKTRHGIGKYIPSMIRPDLCTHVYYAFALINTEEGRVLITPDIIADLKELQELKKRNPLLKILLGIEGKFERFLESHPMIRSIAKHLGELVEEYALDGIDFFAKKLELIGGKVTRRLVVGLEWLARETRREVLIKRAVDKPFLITLTIDVKGKVVPIAEEIKLIVNVIDWINLVMYDVVTYRDRVVGHHSPVTVLKAAIKSLKAIGVPLKKIVIGLTTQGRTFKLAHRNVWTIGAPVVGPGVAGRFTKIPGILAGYELCKRGYKIMHDPVALVPYGVLSGEWVSFDNLHSLSKKIDLVLKHKLGGLVLFDVDSDDWANVCGKGEHPILKHIKSKIAEHIAKLQENVKKVLEDKSAKTKIEVEKGEIKKEKIQVEKLEERETEEGKAERKEVEFKKVEEKEVKVEREEKVKPVQLRCHSVGLYQMVPLSNWWCTTLCEMKLCSPYYCRCY